jgi:ABC-2 type transport system permease protein
VRLLYAEALKVQTAPRTLLGLVAGMVGLVILGAAATASGVDESSSGVDSSSLSEENNLWDVLGVGATAVIFTLVLGILIVTWEYRHGTITQTFLATPRRERALAAKYVVALGVGAVLALISVFAVLATATFWISVDLTGGQWEMIGRIVFGAALWGVLGVGLGALLQSQVGAIVAAFVWFLIAEPLIGARFDHFADFLPGGALDRLMARGDVEGLDEGTEGWSLGIGAAALLSGAYALAFAALGTVSAVWRDVP